MTKEFTDITLEICGKKCNFKHGIKNKDIKKFAKNKNITDMNEAYKKAMSLTEDVEEIVEEVNLLQEKKQIYQDIGESNEVLKIIDKIMGLRKKLQKKKEEMEKISEKYDMNNMDELLTDILAEKAEFYLTNITKKEFIDNNTVIDIALMRQIDAIHISCVRGEDETEIMKEIESNIDSFLREGGNSFNSIQF